MKGDRTARHRREGRPRLGVQLAAAGLAVAALVSGVAFLPEVLGEEDPRPNVIVIVTDDQSADSLPHVPAVMPFLQQRILDPGDHWVIFPNGYVNTPLCCPSRATMLSGRYAHHSGVQDNEDGRLFDESATLATWLDDAGYHTGLVGKYLNLYPFDRGPYVPQGWDRWWGKQQGTADSLYREFTLIEQGQPVHYGSEVGDYSTDVFTAKALEFLRTVPAGQPFFLWLAPTAPHPPWVSAERHVGRYADLVVPTTPAVGEADVSDKPAWVRGLPEVDAEGLADFRSKRRSSYETLLALDEGIASILQELRTSGELDETVIIFVSDNGFAFGEHRWNRKTCPYEVCMRVPFLIRIPGVVARAETAIVSGVDLAPTIAELAGVEPTTPFDGVSLVPLLRAQDRSGLSGAVFAEWVGDDRIPGWWEVRTSRFAYVELATGERELYALRRDPYELVNVVHEPAFADDVERLAARLATYRAG
jgi:arylsulfatase A-like enzyme